MIRTARFLTTAVVPLLLVPMTALAADEAAHAGHADPGKAGVLPSIQQGIVPMIVTLVVFSVVFAVLAAKVWPAISKGLKDREDKIRSAIEEAELAQEQAKAALEQYERNLAQARAEAQKMLDDAKSQQQAIAAELKAKAEVELNGMREKAKRDIESAKAAAVIELNGYAANLATDMARKILKREVSGGDQQRLITESLAELQTAGRN
jgi:F-type H+-transporting ATPase subunit b